ncbi:MAG: cell division protein FtsA, partial [Dehalococcoidia bacterium]|nr:cell division protein FtsA [Dehalococcoidia bacterium]
MSRKSTITAIDVGTTKIATIIAEQDNGGVRVVGVGITPSYGMHKGLVVNINDAKDAIRDSIRKAEQSCDIKVESAYVGVT